MAGVRQVLTPDQDRHGWRVPVVLSLLLSTVFIARASFIVGGERGFSLSDDAMISLTYARNLAEGFGLRWNPGQPAVEGITNPIWALWMTLPTVLHIQDLHAALFVSVTGAVILALLVWTTWQLGVIVSGGSRTAGLVAALTVACCYPLVYWTLRGMEVGLLALVIHAAVLLVFRYEDTARPSTLPITSLAVLLAIAPLIRLDAVVPVGIILLYMARWLGTAGRTRSLIACAAAPVIAVLGQTALRRWYFGDWLPNTYYLKVVGSTIAERWSRGAVAFTILTIRELAAPIGLAILSPVLWSPRGLLFAAIVAGQCAYSLMVGGDSWEWMDYANRFVSVSLLSMLILAATAIVVRRQEVDARRDAMVDAVLAVGLAGVIFPAGVRDRFNFAFRSAAGEFELILRLALFALAVAWALRSAAMVVRERGTTRVPAVRKARFIGARTACLILALSGIPAIGWLIDGGFHVSDDALMARIGLDLRHHTSPGTSIALTWAGTMPYYSRRPSIDLLGKSDPVIARSPRHGFFPGHDKWDYDYSIRQARPDLILQLPSASDDDLARLERWGYERLAIDRESKLFNVYMRRDQRTFDAGQLTSALSATFAGR